MAWHSCLITWPERYEMLWASLKKLPLNTTNNNTRIVRYIGIAVIGSIAISNDDKSEGWWIDSSHLQPPAPDDAGVVHGWGRMMSRHALAPQGKEGWLVCSNRDRGAAQSTRYWIIALLPDPTSRLTNYHRFLTKYRYLINTTIMTACTVASVSFFFFTPPPG